MSLNVNDFNAHVDVRDRMTSIRRDIQLAVSHMVSVIQSYDSLTADTTPAQDDAYTAFLADNSMTSEQADTLKAGFQAALVIVKDIDDATAHVGDDGEDTTALKVSIPVDVLPE